MHYIDHIKRFVATGWILCWRNLVFLLQDIVPHIGNIGRFVWMMFAISHVRYLHTCSVSDCASHFLYYLVSTLARFYGLTFMQPVLF